MFWPLVGFAALASAIITNKVILQHLPLVFFVGFRMLCGGLILLALTYRSSSHRLRFAYLKQDFLPLLGAIIFTNFVPALLKAYGLKNLMVSKAAFIGSLDPFVTALYAYVLLNERLNTRKIIGIGIAFTGALFLCFSHVGIEQTLPSFLIFSLPELAAFGHVALSRYGWTLAQVLLKKDRYSPFELLSITMIGAGVMGLATSMAVDSITDIAMPPLWLVGLVAYTVLIGNVIGYTMYASFLKKHSAGLVSLAGFSIPIFVTFFGWVFLGETLSTNVIIAAAIMFIGVFIFYQNEVKELLHVRDH